MTHRLLLIVLIFFGSRLSAQHPPVAHTLFLIGDAGEEPTTDSRVGHILRERVTEAGPNSTVLYLGDNIYPGGLAEKDSRFYEKAEKILRTQADWIKGLDARGVFIPGNHDWAHWGRRGLHYVINQQIWIDSLNDKNFSFSPRDGCPGPVEIRLTDKTVLVILDTQWLLHQWDKPGEDAHCDAKTTYEVLTLLADIFFRNDDKRIIVAGHHPLISYGEHGGVFTWKHHLFPITELNPSLYIPMPVVGSIYPLYRKWFGHIQDIPHPIYKEFAKGIRAIMAKYPGSIYVAGHEHALEYILKDSTHFIVSGSGVKTEHVRKKGFALYADDVKGIAQLAIHTDGSVTTTFIQVDADFPDGKEVFTKTISDHGRKPTFREELREALADKIVRVKASNRYGAGKLRKKFLGENYRREWAQEIEVPVFNIGREKGGLKIVQRGGGQQTLSLRLEDSTGHEYVIRTVEKFPEGAVPEVLRGTFAQDLVQDQISAAHPYGALVLAPLAEAAGLYHTNPRLVYIPDDPRLGNYQKLFANQLALFEERPAGDWSEADHFGNSKKIINTTKVLEKMAEDQDNRVDQKFVVRSRLFDFVIGDWDRHDDQWRWATIKEDKKDEIYRPIPRDRDQAFFVNEGWLSKIWSRRWALPKFEGFDEDINWPSGFSFNARFFDRSFLTELSEEDWVSAAEELKKSLTDEVIDSAIRRWPQEIFNLHGERIIRHLKARRDKLEQSAVSHYRFLAREVDITGSDKREHFVVERLQNGNAHVRVFKITKEGEQGKKLYDRVFKRNETKEIRLYGLGGDDFFSFSGTAASAIRTRVIGGSGRDVLADSSRVSGMVKKTLFYDHKLYGKITSSGEVRDRRSTDPSINVYNRKEYQYDRMAPLAFATFNPDDGVFIGGGFGRFAYGFRKQPYKSRQLVLASYAPATSSYNFKYHGRFTEVIGNWDLELDVDLKSPNYVNNFFGMGNESVFNKDITKDPGIVFNKAIHYYRYRFEELRVEPSLLKRLGNSSYVRIGPAFQRIEMEDPAAGQDRFIEAYAVTLPYDLFNGSNVFGGAQWQLGFDERDNRQFTRRGFSVNIQGRNMAGLNKQTRDFSSYEGSMSVYHSFHQHGRLVFAIRVGGGVNYGKYEFYQAQVLDGKTELRGFRKNRFYGDSKFYSNFEVRLRLINFRSYMFPAAMGVIGFHDVGRVWYKDDLGIDPSSANGISDVWHRGWGGGIWFTPFNFTVLSAEAGSSPEGAMVYVRMGFMF